MPTTYNNQKQNISTFLLVLVYAAAFYGLQFFLYKIGILANYPTEKNMGSWDVGWYQSIATDGYKFTADASNSGFYILLPLIWKLLHVGVIGMSVANIVIFATGFTLLCDLLKLTSTTDKLLWLSIPTVYFAFIPYTEPLYFLLCTTTLYGIHNKKRWIIWVSLILLSLTRSTAIFLLPCFLVMNLVIAERKYWLQSIGNYIIDYAAPLLVGSAAFILYQYVATGVWFAYYIQQSTHWDHKFSWPGLPLNNTEGNRTVWLAALAVFAGIVALVCVLIAVYKWLLKNKPEPNKFLLLANMYLSITIFIVVFYGPRWTGPNNTNAMGAHRYGLMSVFFYIFLYHFTKEQQYNWRHYLGVFVLTTAVWLLFGSYSHIQHVLFFTVDSFIVLLYMLSTDKRLEWPAITLIALNVFFQIHMYQQFISVLYPD